MANESQSASVDPGVSGDEQSIASPAFELLGLLVEDMTSLSRSDDSSGALAEAIAAITSDDHVDEIGNLKKAAINEVRSLDTPSGQLLEILLGVINSYEHAIEVIRSSGDDDRVIRAFIQRVKRLTELISAAKPRSEESVDQLPDAIAGISNEENGSDALESTSEAAHSLDFRSVRWFGTRYDFTSTQAACLKILWNCWEQGTPGIGELTILEAAGSGADRLRDVFGKGKHPAWGKLIRPTTQGAFELAEDNKKNPHTPEKPH